MASSSKYWQQRFEAMHDAILKDGTDCYDDAERLFRKASDSIQADIAKWYMRLADNNQMTLAEAQKLLRDDELKEFHWTVEEYIKRGQASREWAKELENASAKFHISRLEALQIQMQQHLEELYGGYTDDLDKAMGDTYRQGYYKTAYNIQTGIHMGFDIGQIPKDQVDTVLKKPWAADGQNFSDRIWTDKAKLLNNLEDILTQGLVRGDPLQKMARELSHRMDVSLSNAARLITTESAYFASKGEYDCMKELGVEEYEFVATLDRRTSDICRSMDGKVIPMKDFKPGVTAPPLHCYCRSCTVPHVEDVAIKMKRAARDQKTGKTILIDDMPYSDWYSIFVEKKQSYESWKKARDAAVVVDVASNVVFQLIDDGEGETGKAKSKSVIMEPDTTGRDIKVIDVCKLDRELYSVVTPNIRSDEVIITEVQIAHIENHHKGDYERYSKYFRQVIQEPDYILNGNKPNTAVVMKTIGDEENGVKLILRLQTAEDPVGFKNSIITFQKVEKKRFNRYLRNADILYSRGKYDIIKTQGKGK